MSYRRMLPSTSVDDVVPGGELERCLWVYGMGMSLGDELSFAAVAQALRHFLTPTDVERRDFPALFLGVAGLGNGWWQ